MTPGARAPASDDRKLALAYAARLMQARFDESRDIAVTGGELLALTSAIHGWLVEQPEGGEPDPEHTPED